MSSVLEGNKPYLIASIILLVLGFSLLGYYFYLTQISQQYQFQDITQLKAYIDSIQPKPLDETEKNGILYMREEEKLARDVYLYLYDLWGSKIFSNIAHSEQIHMDAVLLLIQKYNLTDPVNDTRGVFQNEHLQELYNQLIENGSKSLEDAYRVGALIEEVDIIDLEDYIAKTDNEDIKAVYEFLMQGSYNHLRAFVKQLDNMGVKYEPVLLDKETYEEIISSTNVGYGPSRQAEPTTPYYFYAGLILVIAGVVVLIIYMDKQYKSILQQSSNEDRKTQ